VSRRQILVAVRSRTFVNVPQLSVLRAVVSSELLLESSLFSHQTIVRTSAIAGIRTGFFYQSAICGRSIQTKLLTPKHLETTR
jgi:hypothetical protein